MRFHAIRGQMNSSIYGAIVSNEIIPSKPLKFLIDTGSQCSMISACWLDTSFDCGTLKRGADSLGATGTDITYVLHNVRLFLFTKKGALYYIQTFKEMGVLPRKYDRDNRLLAIPNLLGMDVIGNTFKLIYSKRKTILKSRKSFRKV